MVPFVLSYLITPIFLHRYTIAASIACFVLAAAGLSRFQWRHLWYIAVVVVLVGLVAPLPTYYSEDQRAATFVEGSVDPGELVVISSESNRYTFDYYADEGSLSVVPMDEAASADEIRRQTADRDTVWFVSSHLGETNEKRYVDAFTSRYTLVERQTFNNIVVRRYGPRDTSTSLS